jgi:7,8-dihydropterin-6-yl-methyl-4-(beta-D-ribofuranosyl)aminobenzene 5'-phosphate synthase
MRVTTLIENYLSEGVNKGLKSQHGLSLFLELGNKKILFDTGQDELFYKNAKILGKKIEEVDILVISHAHYDHLGGLKKFLEVNKKAKIIMKEEALEGVYSKRLGIYKYIGINKEIVDKNRDRFIFFKDELILDSNISFISNTVFSGDTLKGNAHLYKKEKNKYVLDSFKHELIMVVEEENSLIILTGCSHNGIWNMIKSVEKKYTNKKIKGVIGGFHLQNNITKRLGEPKKRVLEIGEELKKIPHIYTGHCTGKEGFNLLKTVLKNNIVQFHVGSIFEL